MGAWRRVTAGWIEQLARKRGHRLSEEDDRDGSADAETLLPAVPAGMDLPDE
jgi:hypothetical protein